MNTGDSLPGTRSISTSDTFGTNEPLSLVLRSIRLNRAFSAVRLGLRRPGALPQARLKKPVGLTVGDGGHVRDGGHCLRRLGSKPVGILIRNRGLFVSKSVWLPTRNPWRCLRLVSSKSVGLVLALALLWIPTAHAESVRENLEPFLETHCYDCHDDTSRKGDLNLLDLTFDPDDKLNLVRWAKVYDQVTNGVMPPDKKAPPTAEDARAFTNRLGEAITQADVAWRREHGRSQLRRMNRTEYENALRDLLEMPNLNVQEMLPPDGLSHGFNKSSEALDFSHVQISRYLEAADLALREALAKETNPPPSKVIRAALTSVQGAKDTVQTFHVQLKHGIGIPLIGTDIDPTLETYRGNFAKRQPGYVLDPEPHFDGVATFINHRNNHNIVVKKFKVETTGWYKLRVHGFGMLNDHGKLVPSNRTETVAFYAKDGRLLGRCDLPPNVPTTSETLAWLKKGEPIEYLAVSTPNKNLQFPRNERFAPFAWHHFKSHGIGIQWFEMEGPLPSEHDAPPASHRVLLGDQELAPSSPADAERLIKAFVRKAYRRPVTSADFALPISIANEKLESGERFEEAIIAAYRAVLCSPDFLLLRENRKPNSLALDDDSLASRLSYFLWSSPPDKKLRRLAGKERLSNPDKLRKQTDRLLNDEKSKRFVSHFLDYWLDLRNAELTQPDQNLYPEYKHFLLESMLAETRAYFREMLATDLGIRYLINSDFAMLNQPLAQLYGLPLVPGSDVRRVSLPPDSVRGGILTQASLLKITANGTTTSPVTRGVFVLDRILGDPAPPPPESVSAVDPDLTGATTIREQLDKHRADPSCASCHQKIDPPGFALESFDVMGAWRKRYRASAERGKGARAKANGKPVEYKYALPVDSAGQLPDGRKFQDIREFRSHLTKSERQIARNLLHRFVGYATGAPVSFADRTEVERILDQIAPQGYGVRSMIYELIQSELFRLK